MLIPAPRHQGSIQFQIQIQNWTEEKKHILSHLRPQFGINMTINCFIQEKKGCTFVRALFDRLFIHLKAIWYVYYLKHYRLQWFHDALINRMIVINNQVRIKHSLAKCTHAKYVYD